MRLPLATALIILLPAFAGCASPAPAVARKHNPQRIISLAPSITETLFAVGAGDRVVGVTAFCNWPPEAADKPVVGEFARVNFEMLLWLMPDLVIAISNYASETVNDSLDQYNIHKLAVSASNVAEVTQMIREIGSAVAEESNAEHVALNMERRSRIVEQKVKGASPVKAILVFGHEPLVLAGPGTFADDLIRLAGGVNIAGDSRVRYPKYSIERIVYKGPEVIIEASHSAAYHSPDRAAIRDFWGQWPDIPAVKSGRVIVVNTDLVTRPGPRIVEGLEIVAEALHPEKMSETH